LTDGLDTLKAKYQSGAFEYIEGIVEVALGVFLCFFGGPMIMITTKVCLFFGITGGSFMGFQSLFDATNMYPAFTAKEQTPQLIIGGVCIVLGLLGAWLLSKYVATKANMVKLIAFGAAAGACFMLTVGITMPGWAKYLSMVVAGVIGIYLVKGKENPITAYGTAFIGGIILLHGISMYAGGFPTMSDAKALANKEFNYFFIGYCVGAIILTIGGGMWQMKKVQGDDDDFFKQEEEMQ